MLISQGLLGFGKWYIVIMMDFSFEKLGNSRKEGVRGPKPTSPRLNSEVLGDRRQMIRAGLPAQSPTALGFALGAPRGAEVLDKVLVNRSIAMTSTAGSPPGRRAESGGEGRHGGSGCWGVGEARGDGRTDRRAGGTSPASRPRRPVGGPA